MLVTVGEVIHGTLFPLGRVFRCQDLLSPFSSSARLNDGAFAITDGQELLCVARDRVERMLDQHAHDVSPGDAEPGALDARQALIDAADERFRKSKRVLLRAFSRHSQALRLLGIPWDAMG